MPKATDTQEVKDTELIGRSLHGKKDSEVFCDRGFIKWQQFYDSRLDENLSVDRIGNKNIDRGSLLYLLPLAKKRMDKPFKGWAVIQVKKMRAGKRSFNIIPTPINDDENPDNSNELHADIDRQDFRSETLAYTLAVTLSHLVSEITNLSDNKKISKDSVPVVS